jgi:spermidine/putrescine transport system permease protein
MLNGRTKSVRFKSIRAYFLLIPTVIFELIFFVLPLFIIFLYSFSKVDAFGRVTFEYTVNNYSQVFTIEFIRTILRTFGLAVISTLICLILGYPLAYYIGFKEKKHRNLFLMLIIIPFWISFVTRTYSIISVFDSNGILNQALALFGFIKDRPQWLYNWYSVITGMVYNYLPMMVLPIYTSIEKLNPSYLEAAQSLGANKVSVFLKVTLPLTFPGILAGSILVFIPAIGEFLIPELLGGVDWYMMGNYLWMMFLTIGNYPLGAALSIVLISIVLVITLVYVKYFAKEVDLGF